MFRQCIPSFFEGLACVCLCVVVGGVARAEEAEAATFPLSEIQFLRYSPDGKELYASVKKGLLTLDARTGEPKSLLPTREGRPQCCSADGTHLQVPRTEAGESRIYSRITGKLAWAGRPPFNRHYAYRFDQSCDKCFVFRREGVFCYSMSRNEMQWEMPAATDTPGRYLGMSPRGGKLAAVSALELNAYDAHTGRHLKQLRLSNSQGDRITPEFAAFSADEKRMVVVSDFVGGQFDLASMVLVDTETWSRIAQFEYLRTALHESFIGAAASDDLSTIAALSISAPKGNGAIIRVWQPNKGNAKVLACGDELPIRILHMSPDGQQLLASGLGPAFAFRLSDGEPIWSWPNWDHFDQCPDGLDFDKCTITCPIGPIKQEAEQEPTKRKRD